MFALAKRYEIIKKLGDGGHFGITFLARDILQPSKPLCVVKQLRPNYTNHVLIKFFEAEAITLEKLGKHPHIPQLLAHFEEDQNFYIVQEYIEGHDLSEEIFRGKQLSEDYVTKLLQEILEILCAVHQHSVIHRDIKPPNLMRRRRDGRIFLIDFGAVKELGTLTVNNQGKMNSTVVIGTPGYMPYEQAMGQACFASDIYALGITAIQALTGILPSELQQESHTGEIIWRPHARVSNHLGKILTKMVRHNKSQRYENVAAVLEDLNSRRKYSPRRAIVAVGLVVAGSVATFIGGNKIVNPFAPIKPVSIVTSFATPTRPEVLGLAHIPTEKVPSEEYEQSWNSFIRDMESSLGIPVKIFDRLEDYPDVIDGINNGEIHIAVLGGKSYVKARKGKMKALAFAQALNEDENNSKGYYSYLIANKNNPKVEAFREWDENKTEKDVINAIKNSPPLKFVFNDRDSTSGFLVPHLCFFAKNGVDSEKAFHYYRKYGAEHEETARAVARKDVDIATNNSEALARLEKRYPQDHAKIKVIWKSRIFPSDPIAYDEHLPEDLKNEIRNFFYNYNDKKVLNALGWSKFDQANDNTWQVIRDLDDIENQITEIKSNKGLTEGEKQQELVKLKQPLNNICNP